MSSRQKLDALLAASRELVDGLSDMEANHGGLPMRDVLVKAGKLRLELAGWPAPAPETQFPVATMLEAAQTVPALAALLLRVPDALILSHGLELEMACGALDFLPGAEWLLERGNALHQVRDAHGLVPAGTATRLEALRENLSRLAAGMPA